MNEAHKKKISEANKGRVFSDAHKKAISFGKKGQPSPKGMLGKTQTKEWKEENGKRMIGNTHGFKKGHSMNKGKKASIETVEKLRKSHLGKVPWNKGLKGVHSEESLKKNREWHIENPNKVFKDTSIELLIEAELVGRGINFQKQVPLCKIARVDFYLPEYRVVIQADGCYWHNCPIHGRGDRKNCGERDAKQNAVLTFNGFNVYRFWEHEINESVEDCINRITF